MKKVALSVLLVCSIGFAAESQKKQNPVDCVESLQNDIIDIIYSNSTQKDNSVENLTEKINKTFEKDCDMNTTNEKSQKKVDLLKEEAKKDTSVPYVIILDTTQSGENCIETFQNEISKIVNSDPENKNKEKAIKVIIKGDGNNCTSEPEKK